MNHLKKTLENNLKKCLNYFRDNPFLKLFLGYYIYFKTFEKSFSQYIREPE